MKLSISLLAFMFSFTAYTQVKKVNMRTLVDSIIYYHCVRTDFRTLSDFVNSRDFKALESCYQQVFKEVVDLNINPPDPTADHKTEQRLQLSQLLSELTKHYNLVRYQNDLIDAHRAAAQN